jgi:PPP family 3-phenylpropionic acid transporter
MERHGYSHTAIGLLWAVGVIAEVLVFLVMGRLLHRLGARMLWTTALLLTALRWLLTALYPEHGWVMLLTQTLHAASFGICHAIAIHLVHHFFSGPHQGRGQALYASVSFGAGGALGSIAAGWIWALPDGATLTFALAAVAALLAALWAWFGLRDYGRVKR